MEDRIAGYRKNYIKEMRKVVGHAPLMVISCGVIIENDKGEILLQKRRDNGCWGLPGGGYGDWRKIYGSGKKRSV